MFNEDLERLILANSRQPELVRGDMDAQMAATRMGAQRIQEVCERFGAAVMTDAFAALLRGAGEELRAAIKALPDGELRPKVLWITTVSSSIGRCASPSRCG